MARQFVRAMTMMTLMAVMSLTAAVVSANGQTSRHATANVPFDFVVGDAQLAAGRYRVETATAVGDGMRISGSEKSVFRLSSKMQRAKAADESQLVFHRYGNQYFLAEIWIAGERDGRQLAKSTGEKATERELASTMKRGNQRFERVAIALAQE